MLSLELLQFVCSALEDEMGAPVEIILAVMPRSGNHLGYPDIHTTLGNKDLLGVLQRLAEVAKEQIHV